MTDITNIRFINVEETSIHVEPQGWSCTYPLPDTWHKTAIENWLEGKTAEWLAQEAIYNNYTAIMGYDQAVLDYEQYQQDQLNYEACIADPNQTDCVEPEVVEYPTKPQGYYTQEEADESVELHNQWLSDKTEWEANPENDGIEYYVREPLIKLIPADLPVVDAPSSELVPNTIAPYDPDYGLTPEQIQARDVAQAEQIVKTYVQIPIDNYNQTNGVNFESVYNCTAYKDVATYPHQAMCVQAIEWNAQVWESARQLQIDIALGNVAKPATKEEFISHLPPIPTFG